MLPTDVSMPHAALFVVQGWMSTRMVVAILRFQCRTRLCLWCKSEYIDVIDLLDMFQCRTRLCLWCKTIAHSPCISCVQRLFWKVSGCLRWLSERMQNTYSNTTSLSGAIPCAISPCHAHGRIGKSRRCSAALRRIPATFHFVLCTIYIIAATAPNDKYLCSRKKASAREL